MPILGRYYHFGWPDASQFLPTPDLLQSTIAMSIIRFLIVLGLIALLTFPAAGRSGKKKKNGEEDVTQTLPLLKDPPPAVIAETGRLSFRVSTLSAKGLLSQQVREALKALLASNRGATIVKLRAFVAGTGDMRRVQAIVSELFTERHLPLPVLSVIQGGALPLEGSQVVLESTATEKKIVNPHGVAFLSGQAAPSAEQSVAQLRTALQGVGLGTEDVLRATCFLPTLEDISATRNTLSAAFPAAALNYVQVQRAPMKSTVECEAVARLKKPAGEALRLVNPSGLAASPNYSQVALVGAQRLVLTGTQMAFRSQDEDVRLAFGRLRKDIEPLGAHFDNVAMSSAYPLTRFIAERISAMRFEFFNKDRPPASTLLLFEGLPSLDASFAIDVVAVLP